MTENKKFTSCYPAAVIEGQGAGWNQAVEMEVIAQGLVPGVEHPESPAGRGDECDQTPAASARQL